MDICSIIEAHEHKPDEAVLSALRIVTARDGEHCTKQGYKNIDAGINSAISNVSEKTNTGCTLLTVLIQLAGTWLPVLYGLR
jgi:hypothetical protein